MQLIVKLTFHDTLSSASVCVYMYLDVMSDITKHCLYFCILYVNLREDNTLTTIGRPLL